MLGIQDNLKEYSQSFFRNNQNQAQASQSVFTYSNQEQFIKIAEIHRNIADIHILETELINKQQLLTDIVSKIKLFYEQKAKKRHLEAKQQKLQSDLQQLQTVQEKLKKELRLVTQEEQIMKGKMIVEHNKITQIKEECNNEAKRKELLLKHLQQIRRGADVLKKKIKISKQELKRANSVKPKIQQNSLRIQIKNLMEQSEIKKKTLASLLKEKQQLIQPKQYAQLLQKVQLLRQKCVEEEAFLQRYQQLRKSNDQIQERILFLKTVDVQLINQKKAFIQKLSQRYSILQAHRNSQNQDLLRYQSQLLILESKHKQNLSAIKKIRRKRQAKVKQSETQTQIIADQGRIQKQGETQQKTVSRWKGKALKQLCFATLTILSVLSLLSYSVSAIYI